MRRAWRWSSVGVLALPFSQTAWAEWTPSPDLSFLASLAPVTATVGDPLRLELRGAGPNSGELLWPTLVDSLGPFAIEEAEDPVRTAEGDRVVLNQAATVTIYRTGDRQLPALPLLWVRSPGDTLVAWSQPVTVAVTSVLPENVDVSNPQAALEQLKDVKGVVAVSRPPILRWIAGAALAAALVALAVYLYRKRPKRAVIPAAPLRAALPPDVAFERGLDALYAERWLETGRTKEFYAALSLLFREYVERRFEIPAVEATRSELLEIVGSHRWFTPADRGWLADWLLDSDLVKFAREDRLLSEAREFAESARTWVRETTRLARERAAADAAAKAAAARAAAAMPLTPMPAPPAPVRVPAPEAPIPPSRPSAVSASPPTSPESSPLVSEEPPASVPPPPPAGGARL